MEVENKAFQKYVYKELEKIVKDLVRPKEMNKTPEEKYFSLRRWYYSQ